MLFDLSHVNPYILLGIVGIIMFLALVKGIKYGIIQCLINLIIFGGICYAIYYFTPMISAIVAGFGLIEQVIGLIGGSGFFATFLLSIIGPTYTVITGLLLFIVGMIVFRLFTYLTRVIFRKKNFIIRFLGMIYNIVFNAVIVAVLLIMISSPLLFKGGQQLINNTMGVSQFYQLGVLQVQNLLKTNNLPSNIEDLVFKLFGANLSSEDSAQVIQTLERMNVIMADQEGYFADLFDEEDNLNEDMVNNVIMDMESFSLIYASLPSETQSTLLSPISTVIAGYLGALVNPSTSDPIVYTPTQEQVTVLSGILDSMPDLSTEITDSIYDIFGVGTHS